MYKALFDLGDFKKGSIVPDEMAELYLKMYDVPPVEKVQDIPQPKKEDNLDFNKDGKINKDDIKSFTKKVKDSIKKKR